VGEEAFESGTGEGADSGEETSASDTGASSDEAIAICEGLSTGFCATGSGADSASNSGFSIDTSAGCSCGGSTWKDERLTERIFNPLVGGVTCCCGRFFFIFGVHFEDAILSLNT